MNITRPVHFSTEKMNAVIARVEKSIEKTQKEITDLLTDNAMMEEFLRGENKYVNFYTEDMTDEMKKEIIDKVIEKIIVTTIGEHKYKIQVINKTGYIDNSFWTYEAKTQGAILCYVDARGAKADFTDYVSKNRRFTRKRYDRKGK